MPCGSCPLDDGFDVKREYAGQLHVAVLLCVLNSKLPSYCRLRKKVQESRLSFMSAVCVGEIFDFLITNGRMKESDVKAKFRQV